MKALFRTLLLVLLTLAPLSASADIYDDIKVLSRTLICIDNMYVDTANTAQLSEVAVKAILKELDPHSTYHSRKEVEQMNEGLGGAFEGIGIRYQMENDTLLVINTVSGGPSEKVGIQAGDRIIMVNDSTIAGQKFDTNEIQRRLRGVKGTKVNIGIKRAGERDLLWFLVERDKIPVYSVDAFYMASPTVGYIRIARFAQTTTEEVEQALQSLEKLGMQDLIIDLQDNGGGYLNVAVELANMFLPSAELVVYTDGRTEGRRDYITHHVSRNFKGRLVVMLNEQSASASEIFAGCIQDLDRGLIVGRRSFGKGLVQRPVMLANGGMIRLTVSHYYTPSGRCIQKPYVKGDPSTYREDINTRFKNGELYHADSIKVADSLLYHTRAGRPVYGGGGIIPDLFVPLDTTQVTRPHRAMIAKGIINKYTIQYFKQHQDSLHRLYPTIDDFIDPTHGFEVTPDILDGILAMAQADSVKSDSLETLRTNKIFLLQLKGYLANDLYETGAYNRIMNVASSLFTNALGLINDRKRYDELLLPATIEPKKESKSSKKNKK